MDAAHCMQRHYQNTELSCGEDEQPKEVISLPGIKECKGGTWLSTDGDGSVHILEIQ